MSPFVFVILWVLALAVLVGWSWWRKWHREWAAARHTMRAAEQDVEAATVFYGSMNLADEQKWRAGGPVPLPRIPYAPLDWRERTMVELAPEALDPGPGDDPPLAAPGPGFPEPGIYHLPAGEYDAPLRWGEPGGPVRIAPPVPDGPASLAPVLERLAGIGDIHEAHQSHPHPEDGWLDAQLADLYDWVRTQLEAA